MSSDRVPYNRDYFENIFARQVHNSQRNRQRLSLALEQVESGNLLEIGCGQGEFLRMAAPFFTAEGIDISSHAVRTARSKVKLSVRRADIQKATLPSETYDGVAAFNVLEHLQKPPVVVEKIYRSLKPGGALIGSVPFNSHLIGGVHTCLTNFFDRTHVATYTPARWREVFTAGGFSGIDFFGEVMAGKNLAMYICRRGWETFAFNLMFVCRK